LYHQKFLLILQCKNKSTHKTIKIMTSEELYNLLSFVENLDSVEILSEIECNYNATFIVAMLTYDDNSTMTIPFIHYEGEDWIFTPYDWQGFLPYSTDEIGQITWRVNDTEHEAIIFDGLPMLAPWQ